MFFPGYMVWDAPAERWRKFLIKEVTEDGQGSAVIERRNRREVSHGAVL